MSKELSEDEVRERFLRYCWGVIDYWNGQAPEQSIRDKISGAVFSILVAIDGEAMELPGFALCPDPHPDDRKYHIQQGEDYYPEFDVGQEGGCCDISSYLHEEFHKYDPGKEAQSER